MWLKRHKLHTKFKYSEDPIVSWKTQTHKSHHKDGTIRSEIQGCPDSKTLHKRRQQATAYLDRKHTKNNPLLLGRTRHRSIPWLPEKTWVHLFAFVRPKKNISCLCGSSQTGYQKIWSSSSLRNHFPDMNTVPFSGIQETIVFFFHSSPPKLWRYASGAQRSQQQQLQHNKLLHGVSNQKKSVAWKMVSADVCLHFTQKELHQFSARLHSLREQKLK